MEFLFFSEFIVKYVNKVKNFHFFLPRIELKSNIHWLFALIIPLFILHDVFGEKYHVK